MKLLRRFFVLLSLMIWPLIGLHEPPSEGQTVTESSSSETQSPESQTASTPGPDSATKEESPSGTDKKTATAGTSNGDSSRKPKHEAILKDAKAVKGLIPLYQKENTLYAELSSSHYNKEFIVVIAIARGIGRDPILGGMTWSSGDDWVWTFRKIDKRVHVVRKNVRFKANSNSPEGTAMKYAYTDSVLFSLPIATAGPQGGDLVDLTPIFMSDLPQISDVLPGFVFSASKSSWAEVKGFKDNVELEVAATYASNGRSQIDSVADTRGVTINVHYSISKLNSNGYKPRLADNRVGFFLTVRKDYSLNGKSDRFLRYINRWHLEPADPAAELSPPKHPIVFWIENTVPYRYRATVRKGIEEWNKAFEAIGYADAMEVRMQPNDADWDAEDINYNTFRWITSSAGFAMGPSRVNPYTGQILDADIIFDADFLEYWKRDYETFTLASIAELTGGAFDIASYKNEISTGVSEPLEILQRCNRQQSMARQLAFGSAVTAAAGATAEQWAKDLDRLLMQGLKGCVMHEVGHTLGLRHNFKGSTMLPLAKMNNSAMTAESGLLSSVMDYDAVNLAVSPAEQGDFYSTTIGPYDRWAIEYGYKHVKGDEAAELAKIAERSGEPNLAYATDEDTRGIDPDPYSNRYDLGEDPMEFARQRAALVKQRLPTVIDEITKPGEDYAQARQAFNVLLGTQGQAMYFVSRFVGGLEISRSHKGDPEAQPPVQVIAGKKQRQALDLLEEHVFSDEPFHVPTNVYSHLLASRWSHWGANPDYRAEFPVHEVILMWQSRMLDKLLSSLTLTRLQDSEIQVPAEHDCFTSAELLERLTGMIFSELGDIRKGNYSNREPAISSTRRNLQRYYMRQMANLAMGKTSAPDDAQTVAYFELKQLEKSIEKVLTGDVKLDTYTRAHLEETSSRIAKVLESRVMQFGP